MAKANFTPCSSAGDVVFVSGQRGAVSGVVVPGGIRKELRQAFINIARMLQDEGLRLNDIVKVTLFIVDFENHLSEVNEEYISILPEPLPARTAVGVSALTGNAMIAVDVIARRSVS